MEGAPAAVGGRELNVLFFLECKPNEMGPKAYYDPSELFEHCCLDAHFCWKACLGKRLFQGCRMPGPKHPRGRETSKIAPRRRHRRVGGEIMRRQRLQPLLVIVVISCHVMLLT